MMKMKIPDFIRKMKVTKNFLNRFTYTFRKRFIKNLIKNDILNMTVLYKKKIENSIY